MKNYELALKELKKFIDIHDLEYNFERKKWTREFYPVTDDDSRFIKWKLGKWNRPYCKWCGKILYKLQKNRKLRSSRYCTIQHGKLHRKVISEARKNFGLIDFDLLNFNRNSKLIKNGEFIILVPPIYEYFTDKKGNLHERRIKERVERKDIEVIINGKRFPFTKKSRTI